VCEECEHVRMIPHPRTRPLGTELPAHRGEILSASCRFHSLGDPSFHVVAHNPRNLMAVGDN
jgi:hypothetical protein